MDSNDSATFGPMPLTFCNCRNMRFEASVPKPNKVMASWDTFNEV